MAITQLRNAYFRGWFAARASRPAPEPDMIEEFFFIDIGFMDGKLSSGGPLVPWNKSIAPGLPANLDIEVWPDRPVFSTRARQEPAMATREKPRPARRYADEEEEATPAESSVEAFPEGVAGVEEEKRNPQLPKKEPQYKLPSRPAYGKRRPARFAR